MIQLLKRCFTYLLPVAVLFVGFEAYKRIAAMRPTAFKRPPSQVIHTVKTVVPVPKRERAFVEGQGVLNALVTATLSAEVSGKVIWFHPRLYEGQYFEAGETLVKLDPLNYQAALATAREERTAAQIALEEEKARGILATKEFESMGMQGDMQPLASRSLHLKQAEERLEEATWRVKQAERNLAATYIKTPISGRLLSAPFTFGEYKAVGSILARLYKTSTLYLKIPLRAEELWALGIAADFGLKGEEEPLEASLELLRDDRGKTLLAKGKFKRMKPTANERTLLLYGVVEVPAKQGDVYLPLGLVAKVKVWGKYLEEVLEVPRGVLVGSEVWVLDKNRRLYLRQADVLHVQDDKAFIKATLQEGDRLVLTPLQGVGEGAAGQSLDQEK